MDTMTMTERERDAIELLDRIYGRKADHQLSDDCLFVDWMDEEIMAFIRKHGAFADQLRDMPRIWGLPVVTDERAPTTGGPWIRTDEGEGHTQ